MMTGMGLVGLMVIVIGLLAIVALPKLRAERRGRLIVKEHNMGEANERSNSAS